MRMEVPATASGVGTSGRLPAHVKRIAIVVVCGTIMSILDATIVNVALEGLATALHVPLSSVQWVVTGYLLALGAVIPLCGWAVRRYGAAAVYIVSLALFTAGSGLCALAVNETELVAFRAVQGVGGGLLLPAGLTILAKAVDKRELPRVMSVIGVPMVLAPVLGPTLGGILLVTVGWRSIFLINVPLGVITVLVALRLLPRDRPVPAARQRLADLDVVGFVAAAAGTVGITYGLAESVSTGSVLAPGVLIPAAAGAVLVAAFVVRSLRRATPLLDFRLYADKAYSAATGATFAQGAALFGSMILLPLFFELAKGDDAIYTGLLLIPRGLGAALGMHLSGRITGRIGAGLTSLCGGIIMTATTLPFCYRPLLDSLAWSEPLLVVGGVGIGLATMPAMTAALSALTPQQIDDASPQLNVIQRVGASLGTAVVAIVLQNEIRGMHAQPGHGGAGTTTGTAVMNSTAFAHTFSWVVVMSVVSLAPTVALWRFERRRDSAELPGPLVPETW